MPVKSAPIPNLRKIITPEPGYVFVKNDLKGADVQAVAWDSNCRFLKKFFKEHRGSLGIHGYNAIGLYGEAAVGPDGKKDAFLYKAVKEHCHAYNYYATPRGLAKRFGYWSIKEETEFQARWFKLNPEIQAWQRRLYFEIQTKGYITNAFGFRRVYHDEPRSCLPEACAWIGQGTVSCVKNDAFLLLEDVLRFQYPILGVYLDVHDELVYQLDKNHTNLIPEITKKIEIVVPYSDPLIIPWEVKLSDISWGDCA